jgi:hypothetical protein
MAVTSYAEVLKAAQRLPLDDQVELAEALFHNLRSALLRESLRPTEKELAPLGSMSVEELRVLAEAILAPSHQHQLQTLLEKNRSGTLSPDEEKTLDTLLAEADQVALLKARALYTLKMYQPGREPSE